MLFKQSILSVCLLVAATSTALAIAYSFYHLDFNQVIIREATNRSYDLELYDQKTRKSHEVKLTGNGQVPIVFHYRNYGKKVLWFESSGNIDSTKDRSEIRVIGQNVPFNKVVYTSFKIYYPSWADKIPESDWSLIWQCPQIKQEFSYSVSPPINIQLRNDNLYVRSIQDYKLSKNSSSPYKNNEESLGPITRNKWTRVLLRFRLGENGGYKVWIDGQVKAEKSIPIGYKDGYSPFYPGQKVQECSARFGIYKKSQKNTRHAILFDDFKIGDSYLLVKPER
ncbi:MAG: polysaccharide lyase [Oligoflexia bacterium]|nr:polysaccharide lyase [Oligoflexia bacterium]